METLDEKVYFNENIEMEDLIYPYRGSGLLVCQFQISKRKYTCCMHKI